MRRAVERYLEDPLAESLLRGDVKSGDQVLVSRKTGEKALLFQPQAPTSGAGEPEAVAG